MTDRRLTLERHVGKRLFVKGVLIDINQPNKKNRYTYGLVFASVHLPNENIHIDHVVIPVNKAFVHKNNLTLFTKYSFTAVVETYYKTKRIHGIHAHVKAYQLNDINSHRFEPCVDDTRSSTLSLYLQNKLARFQKQDLPIDTDELEKVLLKKEEGVREQYLNTLTMTLQKTNVTRADILDTLYQKT